MVQSNSQATKRKLLGLQGRVIADTLRDATKIFNHPVAVTGDEVASIHEALRDLAVTYTEWKVDALKFLHGCVADNKNLSSRISQSEEAPEAAE